MSKMRSIDVSTAVFARIWALRSEGEESEDAILSRVLGIADQVSAATASTQKPARKSKKLWRHDVRTALERLGGEAPLENLYEEVRRIRIAGERSLPTNYKAIVRRELEYNSSDSNVYRGKFDWFRSVSGIGAGIWALRQQGAEQ